MKYTSPVLLLASVLLADAQDVPVLDIEPSAAVFAKQAATAGEKAGRTSVWLSASRASRPRANS